MDKTTDSNRQPSETTRHGISLMSYSEAIDALVLRCKETGEPPSVSLSEAPLTLTKQGMAEAIRVGLVKGANSALHDERTQPKGIRAPVGSVVGGRNPRNDIDALSVLLIGADGKLKALMRFTADDCEQLRLTSLHQKTAWSNREHWAARAHELIQKSSVWKVSQLPKKSVAELRQLAAEAWS